MNGYSSFPFKVQVLAKPPSTPSEHGKPFISIWRVQIYFSFGRICLSNLCALLKMEALQTNHQIAFPRVIKIRNRLLKKFQVLKIFFFWEEKNSPQGWIQRVNFNAAADGLTNLAASLENESKLPLWSVWGVQPRDDEMRKYGTPSFGVVPKPREKFGKCFQQRLKPNFDWQAPQMTFRLAGQQVISWFQPGSAAPLTGQIR